MTFWKQPKGALVLMLISALFATLMSLFGKEVTNQGLPPPELVLIREWGQAIILTFPLAYFQKTSLLPPKSARWLVATRGILGAAGSQCFYKAIQCLPLGDAIALYGIFPVVTVGFAIPLLGETLTVKIIIVVLLSMVGVACIAQPDFWFGDSWGTGSHRWTSGCEVIGYVVVLLGTLFGGLTLIFIRMIGTSAHTVHLLFAKSVFASLQSIILYFIYKDWVFPEKDWMWDILLVIVFGAVNQFLKNYAGRICHAGAGSVMRSTSVVWAYLWQITVFHVLPSSLAIIGAVLILLSGMIVGLPKGKKGEFEYGTMADEETHCSSEIIELRNPPVLGDDKLAVKYILKA